MNSEVFDISGDESTFLGKSKFSEKKGNTTQLYSANCVARNNRYKKKNVLSASNSKGLLSKIKNSKMNFLSNRGSAIRLPTAQSTQNLSRKGSSSKILLDSKRMLTNPPNSSQRRNHLNRQQKSPLIKNGETKPEVKGIVSELVEQVCSLNNDDFRDYFFKYFSYTADIEVNYRNQMKKAKDLEKKISEFEKEKSEHSDLVKSLNSRIAKLEEDVSRGERNNQRLTKLCDGLEQQLGDSEENFQKLKVQSNQKEKEARILIEEMDKIIVQYEKDETDREKNGICELALVARALSEIKNFKIDENSQKKFEFFVDNTYKVTFNHPYLTPLEAL